MARAGIGMNATSAITTADVAERVAAGAAFLDQRHPGWWQHIDVGQLNLGSCVRCVLGQLFPNADDPQNSYEDACMALDIGDRDMDADLGFDRYGFPLAEFAPDDSYGALTTEWCRVITERRAA
jgi:hypothetical protein